MITSICDQEDLTGYLLAPKELCSSCRNLSNRTVSYCHIHDKRDLARHLLQGFRFAMKMNAKSKDLSALASSVNL